MPRREESDDEPAREVVLRRALQELSAIWARADGLLAGMSCLKSGECCRLSTTGREPYLLPLERLALERALARQGRAMPEKRPDGACALLDESGRRCSVYADRPFGCRTFFCPRATGRAAKNEQLHALSARLTRASDSLEPQGASLAITRLFRER